MNNKELKDDFKRYFLSLRKILNGWDLIPDSPKDEYDSLNHTILSHLYKGADFDKISRVIDSELKVNYGLSTDIEDAKKIAIDIMDWWKNKARIS